MRLSRITRHTLLVAGCLLTAHAVGYAQSAITADGIVESATGGFKFPDGSVQTAAAGPDEVRTPITTLPLLITESGSYYLASNLTHNSPGGTAIQVVNGTEDVTIDLMGFELAGSGVAATGVDLSGAHKVEIRNGAITGFTDFGVWVDPGLGGDYHRLIDVRVSSSATCVFLDGVANIIHRNTFRDCGLGIQAGWGSWIVANSVFSASGGGIFAQGEAKIEDNLVSTSGTGISTGQHGSMIRGNTISAESTGIYVALDSVVEDNLVSGFQGVGILANIGNVVQRNNVFAPASDATTCYSFTGTGNYYADNRARTCAVAYDENALSQRDGGGNWDGTVP